MSDKTLFRQRMRRLRMALSPAERDRAEIAANRYLKKFLKRGRDVAIYRAAGSELALDALVREARRRGLRVFEPLTVPKSRRLCFVPWGKPSVPCSERRRIEDFAVVFLPLIAVDGRGFRLGQGGGYYDCSLARSRAGKPYRVGVGFSRQYVALVPTEAHDRALNAFVSETGIRFFDRHG